MRLHMKGDNIILREFAYFDRQKIEDFLSAIEDGLARERTETRERAGGGVKGEVNLAVAKLGADLQKKGMELRELKTATDASLFQRLYEHLERKKMVRVLDATRMEIPHVNEICEITGEIRLSLFDYLFDMFKTYLPMLEQQLVKDEKSRANLQMFKMLSQISSQTGLLIKISLDEKLRVVANLSNANIRVSSKHELEDEYHLLGRVKKILKPEERFYLLSILPPKIKFPEKAYEEMVRSLTSPELAMFLGKDVGIEDLVVCYPAAVVTPIAMYR